MRLSIARVMTGVIKMALFWSAQMDPSSPDNDPISDNELTKEILRDVSDRRMHRSGNETCTDIDENGTKHRRPIWRRVSASEWWDQARTQ